jgi:hypothetical protein
LNQFVDYSEIWKGDRAIEDDLYTIIFNPVASTIIKWWMFGLLRWVQNLCQLVLDCEKENEHGQKWWISYCERINKNINRG